MTALVILACSGWAVCWFGWGRAIRIANRIAADRQRWKDRAMFAESRLRQSNAVEPRRPA